MDCPLFVNYSRDLLTYALPTASIEVRGATGARGDWLRVRRLSQLFPQRQLAEVGAQPFPPQAPRLPHRRDRRRAEGVRGPGDGGRQPLAEPAGTGAAAVENPRG